MIQKIERSKKVKILTWGCQMNVADSQQIAGILKQEGYALVQDENDATILLLNTCSIRDLAESKVFSKLGELKDRKKKDASLVIGVCGCMATNLKKAIFKRASHVDILCGPRSVKYLPRMIHEVIEQGKKQVEINADEGIDSVLRIDRDNGFKAWVSVMQGCDERCTYCVVPKTRGSQMSRQPEAIVNEIKELAQKGYKEITLLGQTVNAYGLDLPDPITFADLMARIHEIEGIEWIRFLTSHPKYVTDDFIKMFARFQKLTPFLHLPYQSGSNTVLRKMARRHKIEDYLKKVESLRQVRPDLAIGTDVIVGFPGETEDDFQATLDVYKKVGFDSAFCFKYSERPYTPAVNLKETVANEIKKERLSKLLNLEKETAYSNNLKKIGQTHRVLIDGMSDKGVDRLMGRNIYNQIVITSGKKECVGQFVDILITETTPNTLYGEIK